MKNIYYINNNGKKTGDFSGNVYKRFIDYAFQRANYFMLVFVNYCNNGYSNEMKYFEKALQPYIVKSRTNPSWPGTPKTISLNTSYKINFYKTEAKAKNILKEVSCLSEWSRPSYPQDLAFFIGNRCWFYSVGHEKIGAILCANQNDLEFLEKNKLAYKSYVIAEDEIDNNFTELISENTKTGDGSLS